MSKIIGEILERHFSRQTRYRPPINISTRIYRITGGKRQYYRRFTGGFSPKYKRITGYFAKSGWPVVFQQLISGHFGGNSDKNSGIFRGTFRAHHINNYVRSPSLHNSLIFPKQICKIILSLHIDFPETSMPDSSLNTHRFSIYKYDSLFHHNSLISKKIYAR